MRKFLVIGFYDETDDYQRFAQEFEAETPDEAERLAREFIDSGTDAEDGGPSDHFHVAGVVELQDGQMIVVA